MAPCGHTHRLNRFFIRIVNLPTKGSAGAAIDLVANFEGAGTEHVDPGAAGDVENSGQAADADAGMNAPVGLPEHGRVAVGVSNRRLFHTLRV